MTGGSTTPSASGRVPVVTVTGDVDLTNAAQLRQQALESLTGAEPGLVIDLAKVSYMDSAGMRVLFDLARTLERHDQRLAVCVPAAAPVRRLLKITHLHEAAYVGETVDEAAEQLLSFNSADPDGGGTAPRGTPAVPDSADGSAG